MAGGSDSVVRFFIRALSECWSTADLAFVAGVCSAGFVVGFRSIRGFYMVRKEIQVHTAGGGGHQRL